MKSFRTFDLITFNLYYFGISFLWNGLGRFVLQTIVPQPYMGGSDNAEAAFGVLSFAGLLVATIVQPVAGAVSDKVSTRWGRRRPFVVGGTLADLIFLAAIAFAPNFWFLLIAYCLLQFSSNVAHGPYQGLLPDLVPESQYGVASGIKQAVDTLGLIAIALVTPIIVSNASTDLDTNIKTMVMVIAGVLVGTMLINVLTVREPTLHARANPTRTLFAFNQLLPQAIAFTRAHPDFAWLVASRLTILGALAVISNNAQFYFQKILVANTGNLDQMIKAAVSLQGELLTTVVLVLIVATLLAGPLSDRWGRRPVNALGGIIASCGAVVLLFTRNVPWISLPFQPIHDLTIAGALLGVGMGLFTSANWAWAVELTPPDQAAHFLGLTNIATAGATVVTSLLGTAISLLNGQSYGSGFTFMFIVSIVGFIIGSAMVLRIRETKKAI